MFHLKQPCPDCPFRRDGVMRKSLAPGRIEEITESLKQDGIFPCHKTIDYDTYNPDHFELQPQNQFCAGALIFMEKIKEQNTPMQIAYRLGWYDPESLVGHDEVIDETDLNTPICRGR